MKWTSLTLDLSKIRRAALKIAAGAKAFGTLSLCTLLFFTLLGLAGYVQAQSERSPASSMKGWAAAISSGFFMDAIGLEVPHLQEDGKRSMFSQSNMFGFVFRMLTDINLKDPKTFLAKEVPGLGAENAILLRKGSGTDASGGPEDYTPSSKDDNKDGQNGNGAGEGSEPGSDGGSDRSGSSGETPDQAGSVGEIGSRDEKVVMIYHSHNRESFLPNLKNVTDPDKAYHSKVNVTLVGKRLAEKLEERGIGAVSYASDYTAIEKSFNFLYSYKYSQKTVKEAFAAHPNIKFVFDIHRDSLNRNKTTATINGKDYAQVYFIIGQRNPHWEKNEHFAAQIHERLEKSMPGLSRGIWGKTPHDGNAEYNQSLSPNSVLIEIGGPYNSLEECYRTVDVLAGVIEEIYRNAEKVDVPAAPTIS